MKYFEINFTNEKEVNGSLSFLVVLVSHGLIFLLFFQIFSIVSDFSKFHEEVNYLIDVFNKKSCLTSLVDKCIKMFFK